MGLNNLIARLLPNSWVNRIRLALERKRLAAVETISCQSEPLRKFHEVEPNDWFRSKSIEESWLQAESRLCKFNLPDGTGGVNLGDRRAIYYLILASGAKTVLEVGSHIGASTIHIAAALDQVSAQNSGEGISCETHLTSVDINDVNSLVQKPWLEHGASDSPAEMIRQLELQTRVEFVTSHSLDLIQSTESKFDFIFLDGDHSAVAVYQEIPAAIERLNPGGVILLHDYYPESRPLWSNNYCIHGPQLAVERLIGEGSRISVIPLGGLPWPTKLGSNVTSLALVVKSSQFS